MSKIIFILYVGLFFIVKPITEPATYSILLRDTPSDILVAFCFLCSLSFLFKKESQKYLLKIAPQKFRLHDQSDGAKKLIEI